MKKITFAFLCFYLLNAIEASAQIITTIAGNGIAGYGGYGGPATAAKLNLPNAVAVDTLGNIYISDRNFTVRKVNIEGIISTFAGVGLLGFSGDGGPATAAKFSLLYCITFDKKGNVYIADDGNGRVRKVDATGIISTFAGNGSTIPSGNGGPATAAGLDDPHGLCADAAGNIYIGSHFQIRKVDTAGIITAYAGTGVSGYSGDGGQATTAEIQGNEGIAMDDKGNLYIPDQGNNRIRKVNAAGIITTIAGNGTTGHGGDGGLADSAQFYSPSGVFVDSCGNLYIADYFNNRVRMVNTEGIITTIAGNGVGGYSGDGGPPDSAKLYFPETIYLDSHSNIYIADQYNSCVRYIHQDGCKSALGVTAISPVAQKITVYPNPNDGVFTLAISSPVDEQAAVTITNIVGEKIKEFTTVTNKEVQAQIVAPGMYFLSVKTAGGVQEEKVLVR